MKPACVGVTDLTMIQQRATYKFSGHRVRMPYKFSPSAPWQCVSVQMSQGNGALNTCSAASPFTAGVVAKFVLNASSMFENQSFDVSWGAYRDDGVSGRSL